MFDTSVIGCLICTIRHAVMSSTIMLAVFSQLSLLGVDGVPQGFVGHLALLCEDDVQQMCECGVAGLMLWIIFHIV